LAASARWLVLLKRCRRAEIDRCAQIVFLPALEGQRLESTLVTVCHSPASPPLMCKSCPENQQETTP
jgi:hypothetical protein